MSTGQVTVQVIVFFAVILHKVRFTGDNILVSITDSKQDIIVLMIKCDPSFIFVCPRHQQLLVWSPF